MICLVAFVHSAMSNPHIYGKENIHNSINLSVMPMALTDVTLLHAVVAFTGYHLASLSYDKRNKLKALVADASFHHFEAVRLMNEKMENGEMALSDSSLATVLFLGGCSVRHNALLLYKMLSFLIAAIFFSSHLNIRRHEQPKS